MAAPKRRGRKSSTPGLEIVPVDQLRAIVDAIGESAIDDVEGIALQRVGLMLEAKAVELAPVDTGNLESSSTVVTRGRRGGIMAVEVRFDAPYAATVHELPEESRGPRTKKKKGNEYGLAGAKYLERPLRGFQKLLAENVGEFLQKIWGSRLRSRKGKRAR